jgi:hypothetical protein
LAGTKTVPEAVELQTGYWQKQVGTLSKQVEELCALSTKVATDTFEPIKAQVARGMN